MLKKQVLYLRSIHEEKSSKHKNENENEKESDLGSESLWNKLEIQPP